MRDYFLLTITTLPALYLLLCWIIWRAAPDRGPRLHTGLAIGALIVLALWHTGLSYPPPTYATIDTLSAAIILGLSYLGAGLVGALIIVVEWRVYWAHKLLAALGLLTFVVPMVWFVHVVGAEQLGVFTTFHN